MPRSAAEARTNCNGMLAGTMKAACALACVGATVKAIKGAAKRSLDPSRRLGEFKFGRWWS